VAVGAGREDHSKIELGRRARDTPSAAPKAAAVERLKLAVNAQDERQLRRHLK
jgi:hypothetical protein